MSSKLSRLSTNESAMAPGNMNINGLYIMGFKKAFQIIDENLTKELKKLEEFQSLGERLMTLKLYKAKIANILTEMEKNYE